MYIFGLIWMERNPRQGPILFHLLVVLMVTEALRISN
jgi:hypothetical protein